MTMTEETKLTVYEDGIQKIANLIYNWYYREDQEGDWHDNSEEIEHFMKNEIMPKAEKFYNLLGSVEDAKKHLTFLNTVNHNLAKELVESL